MKKISLVLLFCISTNVFADTSKNDSLDDLSLEELMDIKIYSATKSYQRMEEIPANITVLTRKDIEKYNYTTLDELLKHIPGLFIIDDTEHFQIGSRGSLGSSFKLMINNNPISPLRVPRGAMSNRNFFATPVEAIDRIEIIKGPQAVTYGSNSMYGSINIITNDFNEKNIISLSKGNNGQSKVFARINHKQKDGGFTLNTSFYETDGISGDLEEVFKDPQFNLNPTANKSVDNLLENEYKTIDFSHRYKNLTTDITYSKTNYGIYYGDYLYRDGSNIDQEDKSLALTYEDDINDKLIYKINFIASEKDYKVDDIGTESTTVYGSSNYVYDKRKQLDAHMNYSFTNNFKILFGSTYKNIKESAEQTSEAYKAKQAHNYSLNETDLYTKLNYKFNEQFELSSGVRYSTKDSFTINRSAVNLTNNSILPTNLIVIKSKKDYLPEFSAVYHIDSNNHIKFLHGKANQLTYAGVDKYEEINSSEINYLYLSKNYQINSSVFYNKAENISLFTQTGTNQATTKNADRTTKGVEFSIIYKPNYNLEISTSITLQDTKQKIDNITENYEPDFSPKALGKFKISYLSDQTRYSLLFDYISKMKASINETTKQRIGKDSNHNITINTNVNHNINKNLSINFNINNLLDRDNRIPAGSTLTNFYNGAFTKSREFLVTLKYKF